MITKFKTWGQKYIYKLYSLSFHIVNQYHVKTDVFSTKKQHDYKRDIDFIQQFNKQEFNIKTLTF